MVNVVSSEQLQALAAKGTPELQQKSHTKRPSQGRNGSFDLEAFLEQNGMGYKKDSHDGRERFKLDNCPFNPEHGFGEAAIFRSAEGKLGFKCQHNSCSEKKWRDVRALGNEDKTSEFNDNLPVITVTGGSLSDNATQGEAALINAGTEIYQRGGSLVRPVIEEVRASHDRKTKVAQLIKVEEPYLIDTLCKVAHWEKFDARMRSLKNIDPPKDVAKVISSRQGEWKFPKVAGVITTQTMRSDGSLLINDGYDLETGLILFGPPSMPIILDKPTKNNAIEALKPLDSLLNEFPFVDAPSRSVALSALITPIARGAFPVTPMHAIRAPTPGSGKSYLLDIAAAISIGQPCPVMAVGRTEEETEKRLGASLLASQPIISIDNVNGDLGGDALCQFVERPLVNIRILGKSEQISVESRSTIFATGNNIRLLGDMTRRVILSTLDPKLERPELKQFKSDPVAKVLADRGKYIAAALTIIRAYIVAGRPNLAPRLASFEGWSDTVRSALIWLGRADPVATMEDARAEDPSLQAVKAVFSALRNSIGCGNSFTASEIIAMVTDRNQFIAAQNKYPELLEALTNAMDGTSGKGNINPRELGKWLSRHKGRIACNVRLEGKTDKHGHPAQWWITDCAAVGAVKSGYSEPLPIKSAYDIL